MNLSRVVVRAVTLATLIGSGGTAAVSGQVQLSATASPTEKQIMQMEDKLAAAIRARDYVAVAALHWDNVLDIHASGWIYTKEQSIDLRKGGTGGGAGRKVIQSGNLDWRIVVFGEDVAAVTGISETYYEVPNPQTLSMAAGTFTKRPTPEQLAALRASGPGAGEAFSPNPYRVRALRLWVRKGGEWKLAVSDATRISERVFAGQ